MARENFDPVRWPLDLLTSDNVNTRRMRVDIAQTGFFEGREFRSFYEFSIPAGQSVVLKFTSPVDFILFQQSLDVDSSSVKLTAEIGGTEGGTFSVALPVIGKNRMASRPAPHYVPKVTISSGGTYTGGTILEVVRVVSAGATAQQATVGAQISDERGLPAGSYYLRLANFGNGAATGVYSLIWEERE